MKIYENVRTENNLVLNLYYQDTNNCTHPLHMQSLAYDLRNIAHIFGVLSIGIKKCTIFADITIV